MQKTCKNWINNVCLGIYNWEVGICKIEETYGKGKTLINLESKVIELCQQNQGAGSVQRK